MTADQLQIDLLPQVHPNATAERLEGAFDDKGLWTIHAYYPSETVVIQSTEISMTELAIAARQLQLPRLVEFEQSLTYRSVRGRCLWLAAIAEDVDMSGWGLSDKAPENLDELMKIPDSELGLGPELRAAIEKLANLGGEQPQPPAS